MKSSDYFFILSGIYVAPHIGQTGGLFFGIVFCGLALFSIFNKE